MNWTKTANIITAVIFALLAVGAIALVIYGNTTHSEPDLMPVCWEDGHACYAGCTCPEPEPLVWQQGLPLTVVTIDNDGQVIPRTPGPVLTAIADINAQLGSEVLVITYERDADIEVIFRAAYVIDESMIDGAQGYCKHQNNGERLHAIVGVRPAGDTRHEYRVTFHELGHALGLAHDDFESSIMYEHVWDDRNDERMSFTRFTDWDRARFRATYGR